MNIVVLFSVPLAFFTTTAYGVFSFIKLAKKWPKILQHWEFVEAVIPPYKTYGERRMLDRRIRTVSWTVLSVALGMTVVIDKSKTLIVNFFP